MTRDVDRARTYLLQRAPAHWELVLAASFALLFCCVPWPSLSRVPMCDREMYETRFAFDDPRSDRDDIQFTSLTNALSNEALWSIGITWLVRDQRIPLESIFLAISFTCVFAFARELIRDRPPIVLALLFNPLLIDLAFSQFRSALASSIVWLTLRSRSHLRLAAASIIACFIHTATLIWVFFILVAFAVASISNVTKRRSEVMGVVLVGVSGILAAVALGPLRFGVLSTFEDRRAVYDATLASTPLYLSIWVAFAVLLYSERKALLATRSSVVAGATLAVVTSNLFLGGLSMRLLAIAFPLIWNTILALPSFMRLPSIIIFIVYALFQWYFWL